MRASDLVYDSMITPGINDATSFRCAICGSSDLEVSFAQYDDGIMLRINCRTCPNHRDFRAETEE